MGLPDKLVDKYYHEALLLLDLSDSYETSVEYISLTVFNQRGV